jgi:endo-1,3-1,4-beta-glycanase ExoK
LVSRFGGAAEAARPASRGAFFDDFRKIDERRWYISDGWANGTYQNCTWTRNNLRVRDGVLQLRFTPERNPLREYRCAEIRTHAALGYGFYEARLRAAEGSGLNSAMFTYSGRPLTPVHDEIDFEILGRNPRMVQLNYFETGRGEHGQNVAVGGVSSLNFHTYAFEWRPEVIRWFIDGRLVRTASAGAMPKTPGQFFFSLWAGSALKADWLGKFDPRAVPTMAELDWAAYTPLGQHCLFPQSITCSR